MLTTSPCDLVNRLSEISVGVYLEGDNLQVRLPWKANEIPQNVVPLLRAMKEHKSEVHAYLKQIQIESWNKKQDAHKPEQESIPEGVTGMLEPCLKSGHCRRLSDCNLYPVRLGWCKERLFSRSGGEKR